MLGDIEDWKQQLSSIIAQTKHNLGNSSSSPSVRSSSQQLPDQASRVSDDEAAAFTSTLRLFDGGEARDDAKSTAQVLPSARPIKLDVECSSQDAAAQLHLLDAMLEVAQTGSSADSRPEAIQRLIESLNFAIGLRGTYEHKHMEAVREERTSCLRAFERKSLSLAKQLEDAVTSAVEGERVARRSGEASLHRLEESVASRSREQYELLLRIQETEVDHASRLDRLELELHAFKLETQTRLAREGKLIEDIIGASSSPTSDEGTDSVHQRLDEVERALTMERSFRKQARSTNATHHPSPPPSRPVKREHNLAPFPLRFASILSTPQLEDELAAVRAEREAAIRQTRDGWEPLEEKVKECGRLVLRMGGDMMDEAKRRQTLEEETHELRMRLASIEATRASMSPELAPVASKGVLPTMLSPPLINAQGNIRPLDTAAPSGMGFGFAGVGDSNVMAADANLGCGYGTSVGEQLRGAPSGACVLTLGDGVMAPSRDLGIFAHSGPTREDMLNSNLPLLPLASAEGSSPSGIGSRSTASLLCKNPASTAASLKMTREQLDTRVQLILGKHGHKHG